jgi:hypothetical protein
VSVAPESNPARAVDIFIYLLSATMPPRKGAHSSQLHLLRGSTGPHKKSIVLLHSPEVRQRANSALARSRRREGQKQLQTALLLAAVVHFAA